MFGVSWTQRQEGRAQGNRGGGLSNQEDGLSLICEDHSRKEQVHRRDRALGVLLGVAWGEVQ